MKTWWLIILVNGSPGYTYDRHFHNVQECVNVGASFKRGLIQLHKDPLPFTLDFECNLTLELIHGHRDYFSFGKERIIRHTR